MFALIGRPIASLLVEIPEQIPIPGGFHHPGLLRRIRSQNHKKAFGWFEPSTSL